MCKFKKVYIDLVFFADSIEKIWPATSSACTTRKIEKENGQSSLKSNYRHVVKEYQTSSNNIKETVTQLSNYVK